MEATTITFDDVLTFVRHSATDADLDRFDDTTQKRSRALQTERVDNLAPGQKVRLDKYKDARLNGLTGTITHLDRQPRKTVYAAVRLDEESTQRFASFQPVPDGQKEHTVTRLHATGCYPA
ncbi:hypothetical protein ABT354_20030 [Streptomyces sp. NPDC000594]|uniref:hypothetical protein n=1 Tax=unclassified Streptomyces TaxID=2593676 RepID=UPI003331E79E